MTQPETVESPVRFCPLCKVADNHPRHDIFGTDPQVAPHMDCCSSHGCPDGSCDVNVWIAASADGGQAGPKGQFPTGDNLRGFLTHSGNRETLDPLLAPDSPHLKQFTMDDVSNTVHGAVIQQFVALKPAGSNQ